MANEKKNKLVPYDVVSPGFEAVYTGETTSTLVREDEMISTLYSDADGNLIRQWSTIPWTFPGKENEWDDETKILNEMQAKLGPLNNSTRQIRAHIGNLVPCDSGFPVTVDELLNAIGKGKLDEPSFHNGCWSFYLGMWWEQKTTQPLQTESMRIIRTVLKEYLAGKSRDDSIQEFPAAAGFIARTFEWLGPASELTEVQKLMLERMFLTIDFFISDPEKIEVEDIVKDLFYDDDGRGVHLDAEISKKAGLLQIHPWWNPKFQENLETIKESPKKHLYKVCCNIASGVYTLSDCHHNTFRIIESWIHGIGAGKSSIPTRKAGAERDRMGRLLFGYVLGLDKWLVGMPMQFLLLDLGHIDIGFEIKNEILRVYAYLGVKRTPVKDWLAGCLWHNLMYNYMDANNPAGLVHHKELLEHAEQAGISPREWMDSVLGNFS